MKATLRRRQASKGRQALYLDIYPPAPHPRTGRLTRKFALGISIIARPRSEQDRIENKQALELARSIQAKIQLRLQAQDYGFFVRDKSKPLIPYFKKYVEKATSNPHLWRRSMELIIELYGENVTMQFMTPQVLKEFRTILIGKFAQNTASSYFSKLRYVLKAAYEEGLLTENPLLNTKGIPLTRSTVVYLEASEVQALYDTPCENDDLKKAFLLSVETGLRRCDAEIITGEQFFMTSAGPELRLKQKKTDQPITIPITEELYSYLGLPRSGRLFRGVRQTAYDGTLKRWVERAGITKPITYHKSRHTCGTLMMMHDVNIRTAQEILGHKDIQSTLIYAHVADQKKRQAIEAKKIVGKKKENTEKSSNVYMLE